MSSGFLKKCKAAPLYYEIGRQQVIIYEVQPGDNRWDDGREGGSCNLQLKVQLNTGAVAGSKKIGSVRVLDSRKPLLVLCTEREERGRPIFSMTFCDLLDVTKHKSKARMVTLLEPASLIEFDEQIGFVAYGSNTLMHFQHASSHSTFQSFRCSNEQDKAVMDEIADRHFVQSIKLTDSGRMPNYTIELSCQQRFEGDAGLLVTLQCEANMIHSIVVNKRRSQQDESAQDQQDYTRDQGEVRTTVLHLGEFNTERQLKEATILNSRLFLTVSQDLVLECTAVSDIRCARVNQQSFVYLTTQKPEGLLVELYVTSDKYQVVRQKAELLPHCSPRFQPVVLNGKLFGAEKYEFVLQLKQLTSGGWLDDTSQSSIFKLLCRERPQVLPGLIASQSSLRSVLKLGMLAVEYCLGIRNELVDFGRSHIEVYQSQILGEMKREEDFMTTSLRSLEYILEMHQLLLQKANRQQEEYNGRVLGQSQYPKVIASLQDEQSLIKSTQLAIKVAQLMTPGGLSELYRSFHRIRQRREYTPTLLQQIPQLLLLEWFDPVLPIGQQPPSLSEWTEYFITCRQFPLRYILHRLGGCGCSNQCECSILRLVIQAQDTEADNQSPGVLCSDLAQLASQQGASLPQQALLYLGCWAIHQKQYNLGLQFLRQPQVDWYTNLQLICQCYASCSQIQRFCCQFRQRFLSGLIPKSKQRSVKQRVHQYGSKYSPQWAQLVDYYWGLPF